MNNQLAIVIPAYKATYLPAALDSIAAQTCQNFTLYVGDDNSPHNLENIVNRYKDEINLVYHRFDANLGGKDLVAQWERCISLTQGEPYIWLFSDDDVMEPRCVEKFLDLSKEIRDNYVIHFNIQVIDDKGAIIKSPNLFPEIMTSKEYLDAKLFQKGIVSYVVEFVFPRWIYEKTGGFQNFDLAWGSDFMTWMKFAEEGKGIYTIDGNHANVWWRSSNENISPNRSRTVQLRKIQSQIEVAQYIQDYLLRNGYRPNFSYARFVLGDIKRSVGSFTVSDIRMLCEKFRVYVGYSIRSLCAEMVLILLRFINK